MQGTHVFALARRRERLAELVAKHPTRITAVEQSVADSQALVATLRALDDQTPLDCIVANAGLGGPTPSDQDAWQESERILQTNVLGVAATLNAVLPRFFARNRGTAVAVSSLHSLRGAATRSAYCASKAFVDTFMQSVRADALGTNVRSVLIRPGVVDTEMVQRNKGPRPMVWTSRQAAAYMGEGIVRGDKVIEFPFALVQGLRALRALPDPLADRIGRALMKKT